MNASDDPPDIRKASTSSWRRKASQPFMENKGSLKQMAEQIKDSTRSYKRRQQAAGPFGSQLLNHVGHDDECVSLNMHCAGAEGPDESQKDSRCNSLTATETLVAETHLLNHRPSGAEGSLDSLLASLPPFIKLNVGGTSYVIRTRMLASRAKGSFLTEFARMDHTTRLEKCDAFLEENTEYFFERSSKLFETVYKFYATGSLHRPLDVCLQEFCDELQYWNISEDYMMPCCTPKIMEKEEVLPDLFKDVRYGDRRRKIWDFCEGDGSRASNIFSLISIGFVILSVGGLVVGSIHEFQVPINRTKSHWVDAPEGSNSTELLIEEFFTKIRWEPHPFFDQMEVVCIIWFTFEFMIRFIVAPAKGQFMKTTMNVVDVLAIVPFYLELGLGMAGIDTEKLEDFKGALLVVRVLRVLRVMRILKLGRYSAGMRTFALTLKSSAKQLGMMAMVFATGVIFFATMVYFMEKDEPNTPFTSIPAGFWWCIVTMTTVGYGDVVPITTVGKLIGSAAIMCGVLVLALPITIIVDNFMKVSGK